MQSERVAAALAGTTLFGSVAEVHCRALAEHAMVRRYRRGQLVMAAGDESASLVLVLDGRLKVYLDSPHGGELLPAV